MDPLEALDKAAARYRKTERAHAEAREAAVSAVVAALRAGQRPTTVTEHSPFTAAYVRRIARDNGIEPTSRSSK